MRNKVPLRWCAAFAVLLGAAAAAGAEGQYLVLVKSIPLPGVEGRIDHLGIDVSGGRVFVAALGNGSVEVVNLRTDSVSARIQGLQEPQGVFYSPESHKLYVTNAGSGLCDVFDGASFKRITRIDLGGDADNVHYDGPDRQLVVSAGNGIRFLSLGDDQQTARVDLPGHPEGFAIEQRGTRVFVNIPVPSKTVFVVDREKKNVQARWALGGPLANMFSNFPMSLDEEHGRLFVGTRVPASLKVLDDSTGRLVADLRTDGDDDDIFYDAARRRLYASCGAGFVDVFRQADADHYELLTRVPTAAGARTSLWAPEFNLLFVAVPHQGSQPAEIRIFEAR